MQKRHAVLLVLLVATGLFLAACGAGGGSTSGNTPAVGAAEPAEQPGVVRWTPSTDAAPASGAYPELADSTRPSLVFLYTAEPHTMPDGSSMI